MVKPNWKQWQLLKIGIFQIDKTIRYDSILLFSQPGEGSASHRSGTWFEEQRDHMDPGNADQGD